MQRLSALSAVQLGRFDRGRMTENRQGGQLSRCLDRGRRNFRGHDRGRCSPWTFRHKTIATLRQRGSRPSPWTTGPPICRRSNRRLESRMEPKPATFLTPVPYLPFALVVLIRTSKKAGPAPSGASYRRRRSPTGYGPLHQASQGAAAVPVRPRNCGSLKVQGQRSNRHAENVVRRILCSHSNFGNFPGRDDPQPLGTSTLDRA